MISLYNYLLLFFLNTSLLCFSISTGPTTLFASNIQDLLKKADEQMEQMNEEGALDTYLEILQLDSGQYDALWNASLLHATIGNRFEVEARKKEYFERAVELAEKSVETHPNRGHPYYALAVAKGRMTDVAGTRARIRLAYAVEENVKKAIERMPDHAPSWHLYGVWHSEVANVSRAERFAARFISRGLPDGSSHKAEEYLLKAVELDPESILIRLDLARYYERTGNRSKAVAALEELFTMDPEPKIKDDHEYLEDAREMLENLR